MLRLSFLLFLTGCYFSPELYLEREALLTDNDLDGINEVDGDCNDDNPAIYPGAPELCNGVDDDCDDVIDEDPQDGGPWFFDGDGDSYGDQASSVQSCQPPAEDWVLEGGDCDDDAPSVHPGALEYCNDIDDDCNGATDEQGAVDATSWFYDGDSDGYGNEVGEFCVPPQDYVSLDGDCDDTDPDIYPDAPERCNNQDDDCDDAIDEEPVIDGIPWFFDIDGDGYGDRDDPHDSCVVPEGVVTEGGDCDDTDPLISPAAEELCNDGIDNNCDDSPGAAPLT